MTKPASLLSETAVLDRPAAAVIGGGIVFESAPQTSRSSLAFSSVCVLPSGRWLASCRAARGKIPTRDQHVLLSSSDDEGKSWSTPVAPFSPPLVKNKPGLFRGANLTSLGSGEVLAALMWTDCSDPDADFFNEKTQGILDTRIFLSRSCDSGESWSNPRLMNTTPFNVPTPITGPILLGENGEWICQFETNKHYEDLSEWRHSSVLMFSHDEGASWPECSLASKVGDDSIFYWDQRPSVAPDGGVLNLFWTYDNSHAKYLNIHARESLDGGRSWSEFWDTGVPGQPAPAVFLDDGQRAMVYMDRHGEPLLKMRLSQDHARTWPHETEIVLHRLEAPSQIWSKHSMQDAWAEMNSYSMGLPTATLLPDGDILVVFYAGPNSDQTDVRWARVAI